MVALAAVPLAAAYAAADGHTVIAVSQSGIMHLDSSGALLAWRPEVFQWWQHWHVATNPRNGTVCWSSEPEDQKVKGVMRCAPIANLNQTWELPQPRGLSVSKIDAIAFDWVAENWYLTVSRVNYVCSYMFDRCAQLGESGGNVRYYAAYDIPNRLLFRIATVGFGAYKLEVLNLDGSGLRELPTNIKYPSGLAVDPVSRTVFVMDMAEDSDKVSIYKLDYNGENKELLTPLDREAFGFSYERSLAVLDGTGIAMYNNQQTIIAFSPADGQKVDLVNGAVKGEMIPALAKVEKLLAVTIYSSETQPDVENRCADIECSMLCIPTAVNGTADVSCLCTGGDRLVDLACRKTHPLYAVVSGSDKLQAVDMQTEEVTTILADLTDVSRVDFLWTEQADGEDLFLLFWVDAGSLYSGRWVPGGTVADVQTLLEASEKRTIVEAAVDWVHRHLIWIERDTTKSKYDKQTTIMLSSLDGAYQKNISHPYGNEKRALFVFRAGQEFGYAQKQWGDLEFVTHEMTGKSSWSDIGSYGNRYLTSLPNEVAVDYSLNGQTWQDRFYWVSAGDQSIEYLSKGSILSKAVHSRLLTHPSLADAGGLDVLDSRLYWTERSTGLLWTADSWTGGDVQSLTPVTAGGPLRLLHPWRQPPRPADRTPCDAQRSGCSHFCLTGLVNYKRAPKCVCPDNMKLGDDRKTCQP